MLETWLEIKKKRLVKEAWTKSALVAETDDRGGGNTRVGLALD